MILNQRQKGIYSMKEDALLLGEWIAEVRTCMKNTTSRYVKKF